MRHIETYRGHYIQERDHVASEFRFAVYESAAAALMCADAALYEASTLDAVREAIDEVMDEVMDEEEED